MSRTAIVWIFLSTTFSSFSQDQSISSWQEKHPTVIFVEVNDIDNFNTNEWQLFNDHVIVYSDQITQQDLNSYELQSKLLSGNNDLPKEDAQFIKEWRARNPGLKIITQTYYNQLDDARKAVYHNNKKVIILSSDQLTIKDILNHENNH